MEPNKSPGFHWADYLVFILALVLSLGIGVFYAVRGGRQRTTKEFLMADRKLPMIPAAISMLMSLVSAVQVLGTTAEMYNYGSMMWLQSFGRALASLISAYIFVPLIWPLKLTSLYQYHEMRFKSKVLRLTAVGMQILLQIFYMGIAMFAPATALEAVTGFPVWATLICTGVVATIYTTIGGMKAVIWTDTLQGAILFFGLITVLIYSMVKVGGVVRMWDICNKKGRIIFFDFNPDPTVRMTFWSTLVGPTVFGITQMGTNQNNVQRFSALPTLRKAITAVGLNSVMNIIIYTLVALTGLAVFAYYDDIGCDPLRSGQISSSNQIMPYFVVTVIAVPGLTGLLIAVLFSGALSSISSSLNSMATITWKELEPRVGIMDESKKALITKLLVFLYGLLGLSSGFVAQQLSGHVMQMAQSILGSISGPMGGVVILGAFFPCSNWIGALCGVAISFGMGIWLNVGQFLYRYHRKTLDTNITMCDLGNATAKPIEDNPEDIFPLYKLSFLWYSSVGITTCIVVGLIVSFITGPTKPSELDQRTVLPFAKHCCCCLPDRVQRKCWCGIDFDKKMEAYDEDEIIVEVDKKESLDKKPIKEKQTDVLWDEKHKHKNGISKSNEMILNGINPDKKDLEGELATFASTFNTLSPSDGQHNLAFSTHM